MDDPFAELKAKQKEGWASFVAVENYTTPPAAHLVRFAGVQRGQTVLDVGCGTGVVALTAARAGAKVTGLDLAPALLARARENARIAEVEVTWHEGDVEKLPFPDAAFDVVLSQFGHMFAPRPEVATSEMLRVLKPGGRVAFATWPPEHMVGRLFSLVGRHVPPPKGAAPPPLWGTPSVVAERLGSAVKDLFHDRGVMRFPALSPQHYRQMMEQTVAPVSALVAKLSSEPAKLAEVRRELEALAASYHVDNVVRQDYLLTRATRG